jgi:aspartate aminotransferase-like enzyme
VVLDLIFEKGLDHLFQEIEKRANFTRHFGEKLGMSLYANHPSNSLTALKVPDGVDSQKLRQSLEDRFHTTIMGGQDEAKGKIIRIGHMGYIKPEQMIELFLHLGEILNIDSAKLATLKTEMQAYDFG